MATRCDLRSAPRAGNVIAVTLSQATAAIEAEAVRLSEALPHALIQDRAAGVVRGAELKEFQRLYRAPGRRRRRGI